MSVTGFLSYNTLGIDYEEKEYQPNNPMKIGAAFSVNNTFINFKYSLGFASMTDEDKGQTKSFDFQVHQYSRRFLIDLFYQEYKGFYHEKNEDEIELYPDTQVRQIGAEVGYIFKSNQFSAKAAFEYAEEQLKSAGSFVIGGGAYLHRLSPGEELSESDKNRIDNFQVGVNGGYAYSWVPNEHWLFSGIITAGANFGNETVMLKEGKVKIYPTVFARGSAGYHKPGWAVYFSLLIHTKSINYVDDKKFDITSIGMQLAYVKRFDSFIKKKN